MNKKIILGFMSLMLIALSLSSVHAGESDDYEKKETVRVECDANGTVTKIKVEDLLKLNDDQNSIIDYSMLNNIKNVEGDEEFTQSEDGTLIWENHGEDISYKGETDQELPVQVQITYYLDNQEIDPKDLAGKSGKVKIRFDYTNTTSQTVTVDGKKYNVHVPFLCASALMLSGDTFSHVKVSQGKVLDNYDDIIVVGMAFPGIEEDLKLTDYELTQDIDLPDYVEVSADVEDFELDFTATFVSTIGLNDMTELNDLTHLTNSMKQLTKASSQLLTASQDLSKGMSLMNQYIRQYFGGVNAINQGLQTMESSLYTMIQQKQPLDDNLVKINEKLDELKDILSNISVSEEQQEIVDAISSLIKDSQKASQIVTQYQTDIEKIEAFIQDAKDYKEAMETFQTNLKNEIYRIDLQNIDSEATTQAKQKMKDMIEQSSLTEKEKNELLLKVEKIEIKGLANSASAQLQNMKDMLNTMPTLALPELDLIDVSTLQTILSDIEKQKGILLEYASMFDEYTDVQTIIDDLLAQINNVSNLTNGLSVLSQAMDQFYTATKTLSAGSTALVSYQNELQKGMTTLTDGMNSLADGYRTFDQNAIQKLRNLVGDDLENLVARFKAVQKAKEQYNNFSGIKEGCKGSVVFIYETDEIKKR